MKKSVYRYQSFGEKPIDLEIFLDVNRELTEVDKRNVSIVAEKLISSVYDESLNLDPYVKAKANKDREDILNLFSGRNIFVEETKNEYFSEPYAKYYPWFIVTTPKGRIKIGWRKRVLNICWDETIIKETSKELFPDEDVTRFDKTIHAWGYDKAKEYIDLLLK